MYSNFTLSRVNSILGVAVLACTIAAGEASADGHPVTVALKVSTRGLDLDTVAGANQLYSRLKNAAWIACTRANRVGLAPVANPDACTEQALGQAVRSADVSQLTQIYLETHTYREASTRGIVALHVAAR